MQKAICIFFLLRIYISRPPTKKPSIYIHISSSRFDSTIMVRTIKAARRCMPYRAPRKPSQNARKEYKKPVDAQKKMPIAEPGANASTDGEIEVVLDGSIEDLRKDMDMEIHHLKEENKTSKVNMCKLKEQNQ